MPCDAFSAFAKLRLAPSVCATIAALAAGSVAAAPYRPSDDATVLATVGPSAAATQAELRARRQSLAANPADLGAALRVARMAIRDGRASADPRRYGQAQAVLSSWWSMADAPVEVQVLRAVIRQALHDFRGAEADLDAVLAMDPGNAQARLTRAFVRLTIGDFSAAKDDCRRLPRSVGLSVSAVCALRVEALTGAANTALQRLTEVIALDGRTAPEARRWAQAVAAEIAVMLGQTDEATKHFSEAIADNADIPTLVAYADHLLDCGRPRDVLSLLIDRGEADIILLRLAIAGKKLKDPRAPRWSALLAERFAAARAGGVQLHLREEARFKLEVQGDAPGALELARENWKNQRETADARLVLQAAAVANDPAAASDVLRFLGENNLYDARLKPLQDKLLEGRS
jgi:tetratricopeptide (TPR) repeat protein